MCTGMDHTKEWVMHLCITHNKFVVNGLRMTGNEWIIVHDA